MCHVYPLDPPCRVCILELLRNPHEELPSKFGLFGEGRGGSGGTNADVAGDRDHPFRPPEPLVSSKANHRPARSVLRLSPPSTMSSPTQYVSKKDVAASYRPKSYVSLPPFPIPDVRISILFNSTFTQPHLTVRLEMYGLMRALANVPRLTTRTGTVQGPERHHRRDDRCVSRRSVGVLHRGRETRQLRGRGRGSEDSRCFRLHAKHQKYRRRAKSQSHRNHFRSYPLHLN